MGPIWVADVSKWAGHVGPTWAAQITPTVYVYCPFSPCGAQSSFAPWHPSGTHLGHVVQVGFWYMGPMWAAPDLSHVGFWHMGPIWEAPDLPHVGFCLFIDSGVGCNRLLPQIHVPDHLRK